MAYSSKEIIDYLLANPSMSDADIAQAMETFKVSPADMAKATGLSEGEVASRVAATLAPDQTVLLGDTYVQPVYSSTGSGETFEQGPLQNVVTYKAGDNKTGGAYQQYTPTGELERTGVQQAVPTFAEGLAPVLQAVLLASGAGGALGSTLGFGGAAAQGVGTGLISAGGTALGGGNLEDSLKSGLLGGGLAYGGSLLTDAITKAMPIDASNMTQAQLNDALETQLIDEMQSAGLSKDQINAFLDDMGIGQGVVTPTDVSTPVTDAGGVTVTAPATPSISNVLNTIAATVPETVITADRPSTVKDVVNSIIGTTTNIPETVITADRPTTIKDVINSVVATTPTTPTIPETVITADKPTSIPDVIGATIPLITPTTPLTPTPVTPTTPTKPTETLTTSDIIKLIGAGTTLAAINSATSTPTTTPQYPIIPVPENWTTPPKTGVAPYTPLTPINFGNRNLLIGTQWEKFLDPNYGKVPEPVQYSQPSNLSYNDLMGILGSKQGMPSPSSLSINDIISGIQNQYGQTPTSTVG